MNSSAIDSTAADIILAQESKSFQSVDIKGTRIIISGSPTPLKIGSISDFGSDYSSAARLCIFAEDILLTGSFFMKEGIISAHSLTVNKVGNSNCMFSLSGQDGAATDQPSSQGGKGGPSGNLALYLEFVDFALVNFDIYANGGRGGNARQLFRLSDAQFTQLNQYLSLAKSAVTGEEFDKAYTAIIRSGGHGAPEFIKRDLLQAAYKCCANAINYLRAMLAILPQNASSKVLIDSINGCIKKLETVNYDSSVADADTWHLKHIREHFLSVVSCLDPLGGILADFKNSQRGLIDPIPGNGGNGGNVVLISGLPYESWQFQMKEIAEKPADEQQEALINLSNKISKASTPADLYTVSVGLKKAAETTLTDGNLSVTLEAFIKILDDWWADYVRLFLQRVNVLGGQGGVTYPWNSAHGNDPVPGKNGQNGNPGTCKTAMFSPKFFESSPPGNWPWIHPSQCAKLLNHAKLKYWFLDPATLNQSLDPAKAKEINSDIADVIVYLSRLQARTQLFADSENFLDSQGKKTKAELVKFYEDNAAKIGSVTPVEQLRAINEEATKYLERILKGQDVFGYSYFDVPLGSFDFYNGLLVPLMNNFEKIEKLYANYLQSLQNQQSAILYVRESREANNRIIEQLRKDANSLEAQLSPIESVIKSYEAVLPTLRSDIISKIQAAGESLRNSVGVDLQSLLETISTIAFAPESQLMLMSQAALLIYKSSTAIVNDQGLPINKDYIVHRFTALQDDFQDLEALANYQFDRTSELPLYNANADKLVTSGQKILELLDDFYTKFPSTEEILKYALQTYITQIHERNNQLLSYNSIVSLLVQKKQSLTRAELENSTLNDKALDTMQSDLPDLVTFMSRTYHAAREQIMEILDLTARAYRFWAVSSYNIMTQAYGNKPPLEINHDVLSSAMQNILTPYAEIIRTYKTNPQSFYGLIYPVPKSVIAGSLLAKHGILKVDLGLNEFLNGMANVRVTTVRVWIDGISTPTNQLEVKITHTGHELIKAPDGKVFEFRHDPISKDFIIGDLKRSQELEFRKDPTRRNPYLSDLKQKLINEEANFSLPDPLDKRNIYAPVGPFTTWQVFISFKSDFNKGLKIDKSALQVHLEFSGTNYALNSPDINSSLNES